MGTIFDPTIRILSKITDADQQLVRQLATELDNMQAMAVAGAGAAQNPTTPVIGAPPSNPKYFKLAGETNNAPLWQGAGVYWYSDNGSTRTGYIDMTTATVMELVNPADSALAIHLKSYENDSSGIVSTIHHFGRDDGDAEQEYARQHVIVSLPEAASESGEFQWQMIDDGAFPSNLNQMRLTGGRSVATDLYLQSEMGSDTNEFATIQFWARDSQPANEQYAQISATIRDNTTTTEDGRLDFYVADAGTVTSQMYLIPNVLTFPTAFLIGTAAGDLTISGAGNLIIGDPTIIDITSTEALLVRKTNDAGDVFVVNTLNGRVGVGAGSPSSTLEVTSPSGGASSGIHLIQAAESGSADESYVPIDFTVPTTGLIGQFLATANNYSNAGINLPSNSVGVLAEATSGTLALIAGGSSGDIRLTAGGYALANEGMRIASDGDVGIGATSPSAQVHIDQASSTGAQPVLLLDQGDVSEQAILISYSAADVDMILIDVDVDGDPQFQWDESQDNFLFTKGITIGGASPTNATLLSVEDGLTFKESTVPTADAGYVKLWSTTVNELFFQSGDGVTHLLHGDAFSNIWFHSASTVEVTISTQSAMTIINSFTVVGHEDDLSNVVGSSANNNLTLSAIGGGEYEISFHGSMTATGGADKEMVVALGIVLATAKDITNVTDNTITPIVITSVAHGLENGDMVEIVGVLGNTAANGSFIVDSKAADTFVIVALDGSATTGNGDFDEGSPTGDVTIEYPGNMIVHREVRGASLGALSATGIHILANSDVLSLYVANLDGTTNLTVAAVSLDAFRIGD